MKIENIPQIYVPADAALELHGNLALFSVAPERLADTCQRLYRDHRLPLKMIAAIDERARSGRFKIFYMFGIPRKNLFLAPYISAERSFPSLTPLIHEASVYERNIKTFFGLIPEGHPEPRPLILHHENWPTDLFPLRKDFPWDMRPQTAAHPSEFPFRRIEGEGIYELPVGPVHAGIIEPGHFRFTLAGEEILSLEPRLGYSHKGVEKLFEVLPLEEKIRLSERIAGDTSFSYSLAFCQALEQLCGIEAPARAAFLRVICAELERLANHLGDIGTIMADTGFNFGGAQGARLREKIMRLSERLTGSRFLRGVNRLGGVTIAIDSAAASMIREELASLATDFSEVMAVAENSSSLLNRLKETGTLPLDIAADHGTIGVAGRAVGLAHDARIDHPYAAYDSLPLQAAVETRGDVCARFNVRVREVFTSLQLVGDALAALPQGAIATAAPERFPENRYALGAAEGWRGEIICLIATDAQGSLCRVALRDPSFLNWDAVGYAAKGAMVPDFPLINKSFSLSYTGNDL